MKFNKKFSTIILYALLKSLASMNIKYLKVTTEDQERLSGNAVQCAEDIAIFHKLFQ